MKVPTPRMKVATGSHHSGLFLAAEISPELVSVVGIEGGGGGGEGGGGSVLGAFSGE